VMRVKNTGLGVRWPGFCHLLSVCSWVNDLAHLADTAVRNNLGY
jgi:hypothetical protein